MLVVWGATWFNVVVGLVVAGSDGLDGYMARRQGTTRSGAFLDPLADKAVVLGALITLAAQGHLPWLPVILITIREVGMQLYRVLGRPARRLHPRPQLRQAQDTRSGHRGRHVHHPAAGPPAHAPGRRIWFACALTLYTGASTCSTGAGPSRG